MADKCIFCKKELPESSKLPLCEYHKSVIAERGKQGGQAFLAAAAAIALFAKDNVGPVLKDRVLPAAKDAIKFVIKR